MSKINSSVAFEQFNGRAKEGVGVGYSHLLIKEEPSLNHLQTEYIRSARANAANVTIYCKAGCSTCYVLRSEMHFFLYGWSTTIVSTFLLVVGR